MVDPYPLWVDALAQVLARAGVDVVGRTSSPNEALALVHEHEPDLLVGELHADGSERDGWELIARAREARAALRVVVFSGADPRLSGGALAAGASAYIAKTARGDELALAVRHAFGHAPLAEVGGGMSAAALTKRELEILRLVAEGHSNAQLAKMLWVTEQTVKFHLSNIYRKLDVANRTEASRWAQVHDLLPARPLEPELRVQ